MNKYESFRPVGPLHRTFAFIGNLICLSLFTTICSQAGRQASLSEEEQGIFCILAATLAILTFCWLPESPANRLGRFMILTEKREVVSLKSRVLRCSPYLAYYTLSSFTLFINSSVSPTENHPLVMASALLSFGVIIFMLANAATMFFTHRITHSWILNSEQES